MLKPPPWTLPQSCQRVNSPCIFMTGVGTAATSTWLGTRVGFNCSLVWAAGLAGTVALLPPVEAAVGGALPVAAGAAVEGTDWLLQAATMAALIVPIAPS